MSYSFHADVRCGRGGGDDDDARFGFLRWLARSLLLPAMLCFFPTNKFYAVLGGPCLLGRGFGWALLFPEGFWEDKRILPPLGVFSLLYGRI